MTFLLLLWMIWVFSIIADRSVSLLSFLLPFPKYLPLKAHHTPSPFAPTIHGLGKPIRRIVGAGEDVDVGMGPLNPVWGTGIAARPCPPSLFSFFEMY